MLVHTTTARTSHTLTFALLIILPMALCLSRQVRWFGETKSFSPCAYTFSGKLYKGICWPKNCTADDLRNMNTDIAKFVASWTGFSFDMITVAGTHCAKKGFENLANDWRAIVVICLICFLAFLAVLGGILEYCYLRARKARGAVFPFPMRGPEAHGSKLTQRDEQRCATMD
jgi:hypothetical protein